MKQLKDLSLAEWAGLAFSVVFAIAGISLLLTRTFGIAPLKLGVPILFGLIGLVAFVLAKFIYGAGFDIRNLQIGDVVRILLVAGFAIGFYVFVKPVAPEIFSVDLLQVQSMLGLP